MYDAIRRGEAIPDDLLYGLTYDRLPGHQGFTPLSFAAECGNLPATQQLLDRFQPDLNRPDGNGRLPLELAAGAGHAGVTQALLAAGANPVLPARDGRPVIHHAVDSGSVDTTLALVRAGGDDVLLARDGRGYGPLDRAVEASFPETVTALCRAGAAEKYPPQDWSPEPPGIAAARIGDPSVLAALHETGALALPGISRNTAGNTPLHAAAEANQNAATAYLLSIGTPVNTPNRYGHTPLLNAVTKGHHDVVQTLLLQGGADPQVAHRSENGQVLPVLSVEVSRGDHHPLRIAQMLMQSGADPLQQTTPDTLSPLRYAVLRGHEAMVDAMLQHLALTHGGAIPPGLLDTDRFQGHSLLHQAARGSSLEKSPEKATRMCAKLMQAGADPNALTRDGRTPLHLAAAELLTGDRRWLRPSAADAEPYQTLIAGGADPHLRDLGGRSAADLLHDVAVTALAKPPSPPLHPAAGRAGTDAAPARPAQAPGAGDAHAGGPPTPAAPHYTAVMAAAAGGAGGAGAGDAGRAAAPRPPTTPTHGL